jgi:predicted rRNA methylase YqxC with S4 and FtsJ domains
MSPGDGSEQESLWSDQDSKNSTFYINQFEAGEWEVRYAGVIYRPYAHDTVPNAMQRFLAKWLLGVIWVKLE